MKKYNKTKRKILTIISITIIIFSIQILSEKKFHDNHAFSRTIKKKYKYLGSRKCMTCHKGALGDQYTKWKKSPHGQAYIVLFLESPRMQIIKKKYNIYRPETELRCLRCHTTAGGRVIAAGREGVGCEACHGPAEQYIEISKHAIGINPYVLAQRYGMWPIIGTKGIVLRERMCKRCHKKDRLCKIEGSRRGEISFQTIANYPFPHPLGR